LSAQQHGQFSSGEFHRFQEHFAVRILFQVLVIQVAHEGPGVLGGVVLANSPLKFADNRLQALLHFNGLALQLKASGERFGRERVLRFFLRLGFGVAL
jgi:hypothetical protein